MQALKPEETDRQTRGGWSRPQEEQGQGGWGAFSREPKNQGPNIAQAVKAAADSAAAKVAIAEKRKYEEAVNLASEKAYPSLGGAVSAPKVALNYREVVKAVLAKEEAALAEEVEEEEQDRPQTKVKANNVKSFEKFMNSFEDEDEDEDEEEEEYNAETVQNRRRGDRGIW
jgi:hypothetical protein